MSVLSIMTRNPFVDIYLKGEPGICAFIGVRNSLFKSKFNLGDTVKGVVFRLLISSYGYF